jgi:hypothetical protein
MMAGDDDVFAVSSLLARTPDWVRLDLRSKDVAVRTRAEETLALMIVAALRGEAASPERRASRPNETF